MVVIDCLVFKSHSLTKPSLLPAAIECESLEKDRQFTGTGRTLSN